MLFRVCLSNTMGLESVLPICIHCVRIVNINIFNSLQNNRKNVFTVPSLPLVLWDGN